MASIYSTEPPTSGKVILKTNYGNIDIELWTKEAPKACRNFIQLCLEGYYNNVIFHRIIKGFMIQTGDPTGTGQGGESIWNKDFQDEHHSRLRFSHRGIVAMANKNKPNTNGSQFFITMDKCNWLDKKHTIFGKITGDTIFNAININQLPTNEDFPIDDVMPKIVKAEVIINPFIDIVPREAKLQINSLRTDKEEEEKIYDRKELQAKKMEKLTNSNLISFDSDEDNNNNKTGIQFANRTFAMKPLPGLREQNKANISSNVSNIVEKNKNTKDYKDSIAHLNKQIISRANREEQHQGFELNLDEKFFENGLDEDKILEYLQLKKINESGNINKNEKLEKTNTNKNNKNISKENSDSSSSSSNEEEENDNENYQSEIIRKNILEEKKFMEENQNDSNINFDFDQERKEEMQKIKNDIQLIKKRIKNKNEGIEDDFDKDIKPKLTPLQEMRSKYLKNKRPRNSKETAEKLNNFVKNIKTLSKQEGNWMSNKLKFHTDSQKAFNFNDTKEKVMRNFDLNQ